MSYHLTPPRMKSVFAQYSGVFSNVEIATLTKYLSEQPVTAGQLTAGKIDQEIRRSKVFFIPTTPETRWLYDKMALFVGEANKKYFNVDIEAIQTIQYTEYHAEESGTYDDHLDLSPGVIRARKLSVSVQLTDDTEYAGGDLQLKMNSRAPVVASRVKGDALIFPSWILHGVTPVTKGVRKSLVAWVEGPEWR